MCQFINLCIFITTFDISLETPFSRCHRSELEIKQKQTTKSPTWAVEFSNSEAEIGSDDPLGDAILTSLMPREISHVFTEVKICFLSQNKVQITFAAVTFDK